MQVVSTIAEFRAARRGFPGLGLVPTMGFLHAGHLSLVERARVECGAVAVSIFVNPTQFGPNEDLARYPRSLSRDLDLLREAGTALVFTPTPAEIYPSGFTSRVEVGPIGEVLEGAIRPGHFSGVATVVSKLFNIVQPSRAYFGQKDAQQCAVIRRFVRDLDVPVEVVVVPTMRDPDGLAMSSRNSYLTDGQRAQAPVLYRALVAGQDEFRSGETDAARLCLAVREVLATEPDLAVDYVSVADATTLEELQRADRPSVMSVAVRLGRTRLIDNVLLDPLTA